MTTVSRREAILMHLVERFEAIRAGVDGYTVTWSRVKRAPFTMTELQVGPTIGLYDVAEEKDYEIHYYRCQLSVVAEFFYPVKQGEHHSTELNRILLDVQRTIRADVQCGGLAINILETRNELDIQGPADRLVAGVVEFQVQYRHLLNDPRNT